MKVLIDDTETYKIKDKNKSDQNTFIIDIEKTINSNKIHPKYSWKINNNTNWNTYKNAIENEIEYNHPDNYPDPEQMVYNTAMKTISSTNIRPTKYITTKILKQLVNKSVLLKNNYKKKSKQKIIW